MLDQFLFMSNAQTLPITRGCILCTVNVLILDWVVLTREQWLSRYRESTTTLTLKEKTVK